MAIRLDFVTFTDIRRNTDKRRIPIQVDNISAMLIIQKWQMFFNGVEKKEVWVLINFFIEIS